MKTLLEKGNFQPINDSFIKESRCALQQLSKIQEKFKKNDIDNILNELHDSIVGRYLGFELVNIEKHGFDCKLNRDTNIFLESKCASYSASQWTATFNDTTLEKAELFRSKNIWLALSIWKNTSEILCICYGQNPKIGDLLEKGVLKHKEGKTVRSTQSISISKLIFEFDFKVLSTNLPTFELLSCLNLYHNLKELTGEHIIEYKNFNSIFD